MSIIKRIGASAVHALIAVGVLMLFFVVFAQIGPAKAAMMIGAAFVAGWYISQEIQQICPHWPRIGLPALANPPTATDWMRAARQSLWPSGVVIFIAVYYYLYGWTAPY
jgi:hypothetical protein